jgi:small-conductance mechanosensitive channel
VIVHTVQVQSELEKIAESLEPINFDWPSILIAVAVFVGAIVFARLARRGIRRLESRVDLGGPMLFASIARISSWLILFLGLVGSLRVIGIDFIPLVAGLGIAAVILAVALRPFFENFSAGLMLQLQRPIEIGDQISVLGVEGEVCELTARTVVVATMEGTTVHLPNSSVLDSPIVNLTRRGGRRSTIDVGLAYDTELGAAVQVMRAAVAGVPGVDRDPPAEVFVHEFGESTINVTVRFWHAPQIRETWSARHDVAIALKRALDDHDIEIAFPQRVLWRGEQSEPDPLTG